MPQWNLENNTWTCPDEICMHNDNHALANFCALCGAEVEEKDRDVMASVEPSNRLVDPQIFALPMSRVDEVHNVFGRPLLVDMAQGTLLTYPNPLSSSEMFNLPDIPREESMGQRSTTAARSPRSRKEPRETLVRFVLFDRWWIYALRQDGRLYLFPTAALASEHMSLSTEWKPGPSNIQAIAIANDHLFLLEENCRSLHINKIDPEGYQKQWFEQESIPFFEKETVEFPFPVKEISPLPGESSVFAVIGEQDIIFMDYEGEKILHQEFDGEGIIQFCWTLRGGEPRIAVLTEDLRLKVMVFLLERGMFLEDYVATGIRSVQRLRIESVDWFAALGTSRAQLFNPIELDMKCEVTYTDGMKGEYFDLTHSFDDLVAGFRRPFDPARPAQFGLMRFKEWEAANIRVWNLPEKESPVAPAAGFGWSIFLVTRMKDKYRLLCYDLLND